MPENFKDRNSWGNLLFDLFRKIPQDKPENGFRMEMSLCSLKIARFAWINRRCSLSLSSQLKVTDKVNTLDTLSGLSKVIGNSNKAVSGIKIGPLNHNLNNPIGTLSEPTK